MVQPVPPVTLGCWGTRAGGEGDGGGQHGPRVGRSWQAWSRGALVPKGEGWALGRVGGRRLPLRQGARGSHHVQRRAMPPEEIRGWESSAPATLAPKQPPPHLVPGARSPAPATSPERGRAALLHPHAPLLELGKVLHPPSSTDRRETEKMWWKEALKKTNQNKTDGRQERKKVPFWLVFPT
ncbi:hypothetical protein N330_08305, partial [Leptosomus discolor]